MVHPPRTRPTRPSAQSESLVISLPYKAQLCMHDPSEDERRYERSVQLAWVVAILTSVLIVLLALRGWI